MKQGVVVLSIMGVLYAQLPQLEWVIHAGDIGKSCLSRAAHVITDAQDNVYVIGDFCGNVDFDPNPSSTYFLNASSSDLFVAKYNNRQLKWVFPLGGKGYERSAYAYPTSAIAIGGDYYLYVAGFFTDTADFDPGPGVWNLVSLNQDGFLAKYDTNGNLIWAIDIGGSTAQSQAAVIAMTIDTSGFIYLTGWYRKEATFSSNNGNNVTLTTAQDSVGQWYTWGFIAKYDTSGNLIWVVRLEGEYNGGVDAVYTNHQGYLWVKGFLGTDFDRIDLDPSPDSFYVQGRGSYVAKYDTARRLVWGFVLPVFIYDIDLGVRDQLYVAGDFSYKADLDPSADTFYVYGTYMSGCIAAYDSLGNFVKAISIPGWGYNGFQDVAIDIHGDYYVVGYMSGQIDVDPSNDTLLLQSNGYGDIFVAKYTANDSLVWAFQLGGNDPNWIQEHAWDIYINNQGDFYIAGQFTDTADFAPDSNDVVVAAHKIDMFVAKYKDVTFRMGAKKPLWLSLEVYPTITDTEVGLYASKPLRKVWVRLIDVHGRVLKQRFYERFIRGSLYVGDLSGGLYWLQVQSSDGFGVYKVVKY